MNDKDGDVISWIFVLTPFEKGVGLIDGDFLFTYDDGNFLSPSLVGVNGVAAGKNMPGTYECPLNLMGFFLGSDFDGNLRSLGPGLMRFCWRNGMGVDSVLFLMVDGRTRNVIDI